MLSQVSCRLCSVPCPHSGLGTLSQPASQSSSPTALRNPTAGKETRGSSGILIQKLKSGTFLPLRSLSECPLPLVHLCFLPRCLGGTFSPSFLGLPCLPPGTGVYWGLAQPPEQALSPGKSSIFCLALRIAMQLECYNPFPKAFADELQPPHRLVHF